MREQELVISNQGKVKNFRGLKAWQTAYDLAIEIYLVTKKFPREELYGLVSQMRRAAISVTANIAEGFDRGGRSEFHQFLVIAKGSCAELRSQLYIAKDIGYIDEHTFNEVYGQILETGKLIAGLRSAVYRQKKKSGS